MPVVFLPSLSLPDGSKDDASASFKTLLFGTFMGENLQAAFLVVQPRGPTTLAKQGAQRCSPPAYSDSCHWYHFGKGLG